MIKHRHARVAKSAVLTGSPYATAVCRTSRTRRGSLLVEVAMATVLLMIGMTLTVKVLGWVALERRAAERRQRAVGKWPT